MQFKSAAMAALALLMVTGGVSRAEKKKKDSGGEVTTGIDKQLEWENKVVGPKAGIDKDHLAAVQEQGRREEAQRKKEPPKKQARAEGINGPASSTLPTMDIEKASSGKKSPKKVASAEPHKKDSLDNLLDSEGIKPDNPSGGRTGDDGLNSLLASDSSSGKKSAGSKKHRR
ncbi:MAG: hypothetical protein ACJ8F1_09965 [Polyangia bacterium]